MKDIDYIDLALFEQGTKKGKRNERELEYKDKKLKDNIKRLFDTWLPDCNEDKI